MLRKKGVVGKFVEFYGPGLATLPLADRATIANMAPEYGATCGIFPVDAETLRYLEFTGRPPEQVALVEAYMQGAGPVPRRRTPPEAAYTDTLELDLATVEPSLAGPKRPQDRVRAARDARRRFREALRAAGRPAARPARRDEASAESFPASDPAASRRQPPTAAATPSRPRGSARRDAGDVPTAPSSS